MGSGAEATQHVIVRRISGDDHHLCVRLRVLDPGEDLLGFEAVDYGRDVDWHEADRPHHWELYLENADGQIVNVPTPEGEQPVEVRGDFQVGRPQGVPEGTPIDLPLAVNFGPIPLAVASRFTWRFTIDGVAEEDWRLGFTTRPAAA